MKKLIITLFTVLLFGSTVNLAADTVVQDEKGGASALPGEGGSGPLEGQNYQNEFDFFANRCTLNLGDDCND
jgi:hypothetical protein